MLYVTYVVCERSRLPYWIQAICPRVFYITEKAWNYYPFTVTGENSLTFLREQN